MAELKQIIILKLSKNLKENDALHFRKTAMDFISK